MNKKVIGLIFGLIIVFSSILVFTISTDNSKDTIHDQNEEVTTDEIIDEIDDNLLEEDNEIEIGEMI